MARYTLAVNGKNRSVEADADTPLLYVLRDNLALNGPRSVKAALEKAGARV